MFLADTLIVSYVLSSLPRVVAWGSTPVPWCSGPHLASGVRPWLPQLLPSVEDLFGCRVSIHEGGMVSTMASRKRSNNKGPGSDFGSLLKNPKKPSNSGPTQSQKVAAQVWNRLNPPVPSNVQQGAVGNWRSTIVKGAQTILNNQARNIAQGVGDEAFDISVGRITSKPLNLGNQIKGTRSTIYTPQGSFSGSGSFLQTPARTVEQAMGSVKGQITRAAKDAARMESAANVGARLGLQKGAKAGLAAGGAAGGLAGYQLGKTKGKNKGSSKSKK